MTSGKTVKEKKRSQWCVIMHFALFSSTRSFRGQKIYSRHYTNISAQLQFGYKRARHFDESATHHFLNEFVEHLAEASHFARQATPWCHRFSLKRTQIFVNKVQ